MSKQHHSPSIYHVQGITQYGLLLAESFKLCSAPTSHIKLCITEMEWGTDTEIPLKPSSKDKNCRQKAKRLTQKLNHAHRQLTSLVMERGEFQGADGDEGLKVQSMTTSSTSPKTKPVAAWLWLGVKVRDLGHLSCKRRNICIYTLVYVTSIRMIYTSEMNF